MRKILILGLLVFMMFAAGCAQQQPSPAPLPSPTPGPSPTLQPPSGSDTIVCRIMTEEDIARVCGASNVERIEGTCNFRGTGLSKPVEIRQSIHAGPGSAMDTALEYAEYLYQEIKPVSGVGDDAVILKDEQAQNIWRIVAVKENVRIVAGMQEDDVVTVDAAPGECNGEEGLKELARIALGRIN